MAYSVMTRYSRREAFLRSDDAPQLIVPNTTFGSDKRQDITTTKNRATHKKLVNQENKK